MTTANLASHWLLVWRYCRASSLRIGYLNGQRGPLGAVAGGKNPISSWAKRALTIGPNCGSKQSLYRSFLMRIVPMAAVFPEIDDKMKAWLSDQKVFFVATAPLAAHQHLNCSPKGMDTFRILGPREVAYLDLTGSGIETISHLQENGRIVLMFCAFSGPPRIVRIHGTGSVFRPGEAGYSQRIDLFPQHAGSRAIISVATSRISDSCGYSIPKYDYIEERETLQKWCENKGEVGLTQYRLDKNAVSIDGLPGYGG